MKKQSKPGAGPAGSGSASLLVPTDTKSVLQQVKLQDYSNIGLWLDKLIEFELGRTGGGSSQSYPAAKIKNIEQIPAFTEECKGVLGQYRLRWERALDALPFCVEKFKAKTTWRLVVGLGASHVRETSIALHHVHGFPVIPGSAVKGLARAYAQLVLGINEESPKFPEFTSIFGTQEHAGGIVFFDALPADEDVSLQLDVMTPHYGEYYRSENTPPADYLNPVPVNFIVVENTQFLFAIGLRSGEKSLLKRAAEWLKAALAEVGVGAKSSAGYGYFSEFISVQDAR